VRVVKMEEQKEYLPAAVVFLAVIALFTIVSLVKPQSDFSEAENRALQERPDFDADLFLQGDYQEEYEDYLSDQMAGRELFVKVKTQLDLWTGKKDINGVYLGKDGYLIEKYAMADFDEEQVDDNVWYLSEYLKDMQDRYTKAHVQCMFVPSKDTALEALLPEYAVAFDSSFVSEEVRDALADDADPDEESGDNILDLTGELSGHSDEYIYYRTDHHWTTLGAYYAYCAYKEMRGEQATPQEQYTVCEVAQDFYGTTYDKIQKCETADTISKWELNGEDAAVQVSFDDGEMEWESCYDESFLSEKDKYSYFFGGNTAKIRIATGADNGKCLLLLKDSYSNSFVEFLLPDYEYIYMIDLRYTQEDIYTLMEEIDAEHPISDVLVMYNTEKFMQDTNLDALYPF
jgi:hypothetical protein